MLTCASATSCILTAACAAYVGRVAIKQPIRSTWLRNECSRLSQRDFQLQRSGHRPAHATQLVHSLQRQVCAMAAAGKQEAPGGAWASPISSELIVSQSIGLGSPVIAPDGRIVWLEGRPTEGGRQVLVSRSPDGQVADVLPGAGSGFNARTRVHEYGGGESVAGPDGTIFWSNFKDQRIYKQAVGGDGAWSAPKPLTAADTQHRFADAVVDQKFNRLVAVREDHSGEGEPVNSVAAVDLKTGESTMLAEGRDFYTSPRLNADSTKLAWICYDHPNMPWDDTELWVADVTETGELANQRKAAGGPGESVVQPLWSDAGLSFISDRTDWWNIYTETSPGKAQPVLSLEAEFAGPAWMFGGRSYQRLPGGAVLAVYSAPETAGSTLVIVNPADGTVKELRTPYASYGNVCVQQVKGRLLVGLLGTSPLKPSEVALLDVASVDELIASAPEQWQTLQHSSSAQVDEGYLSQPESIAFPTTGGKTAYMNHYPPANKDFQLPASEAPPLLVKIHGGPTAAASTAFSLGIQFWTSRGYAVADVNYGGSTGYGRKYRKRLAGNWGVVDVDDCSNAAKHLAEQGLADANKLCITGGSAGGYTTLACLAFRKVFSAGASHYGVADLQLLAAETHKFESRYLDGLIGQWPEDKQIYKERSPINALDQFDKPVVFFQGEEDQVVPPNQAVDMYNALKDKGLSTALVLFPGEQHGFRQAPNIRRALDGELYFYGKTLGFPVDMPLGLEPPEIVNAAA